ncbi:hypothetical protein N1M2_240 [Klebsiella phage N1M2]|uniref:Uncharacterized protein n=1 Tax=Klebsiella phage N1M2 TaxID=2664939 RepID=A0A6B7ZF13_9CAUD|nr:hypothetical protein PQB72_gp240 [Klebsiella phage N1M2]QGH72103.1 hypothetical protein N1M2_240 [Klebsiella phage N1M2]
MKKINMLVALILIVLFAGFVYSGKSAAAAYDIKEDIEVKSIVAQSAVVKAEKVMNGVVDGIFTMKFGKTTQKFIMQCDKNQETVTMYYYMKDITGYKAKGATGFKITAYNNAEGGYTPGDESVVYDSADSNDNLQAAITKLNILVEHNVGIIAFEFYEDVSGIGKSPVAYSMMFSPKVAVTILGKMNAIENGICNIDAGFSTVTPLARLTDSL